MTKQLFVLFFSALTGAKALASACCGGALAAPAMILGDEAAQVTSSYSYNQTLADVGTESEWYRRSSPPVTETFRLDAAHILSDRWQTGFTVPLIKRSLGEASASGLGDVSATLAYEYLPDWDYNPWRPKGLGFVQITAPTGRSSYESSGAFQLDARGRGFWTFGMGTVLSKVISKWDLFISAEAHKSFDRSYSTASEAGRLHPGVGGSLGLGTGYNLAQFRMGGSLISNYEDPVAVSGTLPGKGSAQRYMTATISASYVFSQEWSVTLTYNDQTWFGQPANTSLGRGLMLVAQKRWQR